MSPAQSSRHSVSVAAVTAEGKVLAIKRRDTGQSQPPGGVLEREEAILDGLAREVAQETGLQVEPDRLSGVYKNLPRSVVALVFRCAPVAGQLTTTAESRQVAWLTRAEVRTHMDEAHAVRMLDALDDGPPRVRAHDGVHLL